MLITPLEGYWTTKDDNYSTRGMVEAIQEVKYSAGGIMETTQDVNSTTTKTWCQEGQGLNARLPHNVNNSTEGMMENNQVVNYSTGEMLETSQNAITQLDVC